MGPEGSSRRADGAGGASSLLRAVGTRWGVAGVISVCILVGAYIHPAQGMGIPFCPSRFFTGAPCPGCGLTRSVSCAARGELAMSWRYHPFGGVVLMVAMWLALTPLAPASWRGGVGRVRDRNGRAWRAICIGAVVAFVLHGTVRSVRWEMGERGTLAAPAEEARGD